MLLLASRSSPIMSRSASVHAAPGNSRGVLLTHPKRRPARGNGRICPVASKGNTNKKKAKKKVRRLLASSMAVGVPTAVW